MHTYLYIYIYTYIFMDAQMYTFVLKVFCTAIAPVLDLKKKNTVVTKPYPWEVDYKLVFQILSWYWLG